ncbi:MAG: DJ-1/PfpI family protein [Clostridia bacterium]|nr:DJ-1/PfpI family protein [Clostridia bacterium]
MIYFFLADGFEEIEALCPLDLCRRAGIEAKTVSITDKKEVTGSHGITVVADLTARDTLENFDMMVLPGGMPGTTNLGESTLVEKSILTALETNAYIAAICAAPMILGKRGLLRGKEAICFPGFEKYLDGATLSDKKVVLDGKVLTGAGMGVSHDFGLKIVEIFKGKDTADNLCGSVLYR